MSIRWHNVYSDGDDTWWHHSPTSAQAMRYEPQEGEDIEHVRVEQRWNGHWLRPPVGMRSNDTSTPGERLANDIVDAMGMGRTWLKVAQQLRRMEVESFDGGLSDRVMHGIHWRLTPQGADYWYLVHDALERAGQ